MPFIYKDIGRFRQILAVLARYGFGHLVERLRLAKWLPFGRRFFRFKRLRIPSTPAVRFRHVLEELGTTFIKFGQVLSLRRDILPEEFIVELQRLQDTVPPFPGTEAKELIKKDLGRSVEDIFLSFNEDPMAAASIAQVHLAKLPDGQEVVVKVQRPGIHQQVETDVRILENLAKLLVRYVPESRLYDPIGLVEEFRKTISKEMDFKIELRSAERFRANFAGSRTVFVPGVIKELCSKEVLTMECSHGKKVTELDDLLLSKKKVLAKNLTDAYLKQIFEDGFFHADPHPGNIFVLDDGRLCFHDFGMMGSLSQEMMEDIADWFIAFLDKDIDRIVDIYLKVGILGEEVNRNAFERDLAEFVEDYYNLPLTEFSFAEVMENSIRIGRRHHIRVISSLLLLGKAFMTVEYMVRTLDPEFNLVESMRPYASTLINRRLGPRRIARDLIKSLMDLQSLSREIPRALQVLIQDTKERKAGYKLRHEGLEDMEGHIDRAGNRLAFALVVASIVIGSSIIMQTHMEPMLFGYPAIGVIGYLVTGFLGLWLVWAILRSGRL
ncbi:MAG: AarF/ABC1/UbiB kinase family protein [Nitrospirae bacterium]|nr:AarF/ABC1/UbiB kinase family protein [Nitrospirota bacterium]